VILWMVLCILTLGMDASSFNTPSATERAVLNEDLSKDPAAFATDYFVKMESALPAHLGDTSFLTSLALDYLRAHRIQEAIWTLRRADKPVEAHLLSVRLKEYLRQAPILESRGHHGKAAAKFVTFAGGVQAVVKSKSGDGANIFNNPRAEIWAYELDDVLNLDIVPVTVNRDGMSVQVLVFDVTEGDRDFRGQRYTFNRASLYILDFLIRNMDRSPTNWMVRPGGHVVAIDNGISYGGKQGQEWLQWGKNFGIEATNPLVALGSPLLEKIIGKNDTAIRAALMARDVPADVIDFYLNNRGILERLLTTGCQALIL